MGRDDDEMYGYTEIVGEQTRGGDMVSGDYDVLGEVFASASPAAKQAIAARIARSRPVVRNVAPVKARDWAIPFTTYGAAATTVTISVQPQCLFRAEKLIVAELGGGNPTGLNTTITAMLVGQKNQLPATGGGISSLSFANGALGNGIKFDTCQPALSISFTVSFLTACTWQGTLFGKAVL